MSNDTNEREILSAYFDGELSPEDRERAEKLLEDSTSNRREIDEIAELSELIKSLPSEAAPPELLPAVMRQAERDTLLTSESTARISERKSRSWLSVISGIAVTAAAVVLVVQMLPRSTFHQPDAIVTHQTSESRNDSDDRLASGAIEFAEARNAPTGIDVRGISGIAGNKVASKKDGDTPGESMAFSAPASERFKQAPADRSSVAKSPAGGRTREAESTPQAAEKPATLQLRSRDALSMNAEALRNAREGDVVRYFSPAGTKVTTYLVTVVDVQQAVDKMQYLLARHQIPDRLPNGKENGRFEGKLAADAKPRFENKKQPEASRTPATDAQPERLIAVYVETTPDRFASAFKELLRDKMLADLYPKPPVDEQQIEVAQLGQSRRQLFRSADAESQSEESSLAAGRSAVKNRSAQANSNAAPADAPAKSPEPLLRKTKRLAQAKPESNLAKPTPKKPTKSKNIERSGAKEADRKFDGLVADETRTDAKHNESRSFQLQVELAPLTKAADRPKLHEEQPELADKIANDAPGPPQLIAPKRELAKQLDSAAQQTAPVRVLFVFRQAPQKSKQQP